MNAPELRLPPHSVEAEQSLLGALMIDPSAWERIEDIVSEKDFYRDDHRRIFRHIKLHCDRCLPFDVVVIFESIEKSNETDQAGGLAYLGEIASNTPSAANIRRYAQIVRDKAAMRKLIQAGDEIAALGFSAADPSEAMDTAQHSLETLAIERAHGRLESVSARELLAEVIDRIQTEFDRESPLPRALSYGLADLDSITGGMMPGDMIVIAGRPSMGKTALMLNIVDAVSVSNRTRKATMIFSLEMTGQQLMARMLASASSVNGKKFRNAKDLNDDDWSRITTGMGKLHEAPIEIDDAGSMTISRMRAKARKAARTYGGLGLIVIDYMQLIDASSKGDNRNAEITEISRGLKAMAKEFGCPVIALSQLSRKVEERPNKRPMMSDLRESGAIEQDADQIILLYRDDYYHPESIEKGLVEANVAKNRDGEVGVARMVFRKEYGRMGDVDPVAMEELRIRKEAAKPSNKSKQFKD